jgi:hypothetical protein
VSGTSAVCSAVVLSEDLLFQGVSTHIPHLILAEKGNIK